MSQSKVRSIRNIPWLLTMDGNKNDQVGIIEKAAVVMDGDKISWVGEDSKCPLQVGEGIDLDGSGLVAMPGLIDCHTHLVFGGDRIEDFYERAKGTSYAEIMSKGGGIQRTVSMTRSATSGELIATALESLKRMLARGVTTIEVKSGYGLNLDDELKMLEVVRKLNELQPVTLIPTFLGAHSIPLEFENRSADYIDFLITKVLPEISKNSLADSVDVFVEQGAFSVEEGRKLLVEAKRLGFNIKVHADQLSQSGGTALAAELGCLSASHLEYTQESEFANLANAGVVAELLPLAEVYLGVEKVVNVRSLIDNNVRVAIATDYNPGSSMCDDLQLAMRLAITQRKMTVEEAMLGVTHNAAHALGKQSEIGQIKAGMKADICLFAGQSPWRLAYDWSRNPMRQVIKNGQLVV